MESSSPSQRSDILKNSREEEEYKKAHEKYRETIATLPNNHSWGINAQFYLYEGFWCYTNFLEGVMSAQDHFIAQPSDIILSSVPKSGTTWLKALAYAITTRTRFAHSSSPLLTALPHDCVPFLEFDLVPYPTKRDQELPLLATHIPYTSLPKSIVSKGTCKIVYIYRDPKDAFVSLWHFECRLTPKEKEPLSLEEAFKMFAKGISWYGPYWDHVLGYWKASLEMPERVLIMKYEDLMRDTAYYVKKLAEFMGYAFSLEEEMEGAIDKIIKLCCFENLSNLEVNKTGTHRGEMENNTFFRKGKIGDWKNHLTSDIAKEIDQITEQKFAPFMYSINL